MKSTPQKNLITGMSLIAALVIAGCAGNPQTEPTTTASTTTRPAIPTEKPSTEPTANVSAKAETPEEAIAAATAAYKEFSDTKWAIFNDGGAEAERIVNLATIPVGGILDQAGVMQKEGRKISGAATFEVLSSEARQAPVTNGLDLGQNSEVSMTVCNDTSTLKNFDAANNETERLGPKRVKYSVLVQFNTDAGRWVVAADDVVEGDAWAC
jgi:hypothetical protein